jgi:hypothetical protein
MPIFDEDEDEDDLLHNEEKAWELQQAITNALRFQNEFDPEYDGDEDKLRQEKKRLRDSRTSPWDKLLRKEIRKKIAHLNLEIQTTCIYLAKAKDSEAYYYCQSEAIKQVSKKAKRFTGVVVRKNSAELAAHIPFAELRDYCANNCDSCKEYKNNKANPNT